MWCAWVQLKQKKNDYTHQRTPYETSVVGTGIQSHSGIRIQDINRRLIISNRNTSLSASADPCLQKDVEGERGCGCQSLLTPPLVGTIFLDIRTSLYQNTSYNLAIVANYNS